MKKLLITGVNGLLGQSLVRQFGKEYHLIGCDIGKSFSDPEYTLQKYISLNITERNNVVKVFGDIRPDIVINAAAYTNVDKCESERELAWNINVKSIEIMEEACKPFNPLFVHISTDYVFDGTSGPYRETDEPKALGYYGMTKLAAEKIIGHSELEYIIIRTMILYGYGIDIRPNFATWIINELKTGNKINIVDDQIGNPTLIDDLSAGISQLIEKEEYGLFNLCGNEICSRYEFAVKIAEIFDLDKSLINRITTDELQQAAPRPMNSSFNMDKLYNTLDWLPGKLDNSLNKLKTQMRL